MSARATWIIGLALALLLLAADSARRLEGIERATNGDSVLRLAVEGESSPDGRLRTHRLVLTQADGYHYLLQAEQAMRTGQLRVRTTEYDNAPAGRDVHWAGFMRWWLVGSARLYQVFHDGLSAPEALERVAPWANAVLLAALLIVLTPLMARSLGPVAGALLALGCVTVFPIYDLFAVGYVDHHGLATLLCMSSVLCLVIGGVGFVRDDGGEKGESTDRDYAAMQWPPHRSTARRWFVASGLSSGVGLWISAATTVPVLIGIGLASLAGAATARGVARAERSGWTVEPSLFRVWGVVGAVASLGFYLLEYFPHELSMRLEVNHPLYAFAMLGAGDFLARSSRILADEPVLHVRSWPAPTALCLFADVALILALPVVVLLTRESTFLLTDPFLWTLHDRYIAEIVALETWAVTLRPAQVVSQLSLVPLVAFPFAGLLWASKRTPGWPLRAVAIVSAGIGFAYAYIYVVALAGGAEVAAFVVCAVMAVLLWASRGSGEGVTMPSRVALVFAVLPAAISLMLSLLQLRWIGIASGLWLGALVVVVAVLLGERHSWVRRPAARAIAGSAVIAALAIQPMAGMRGPFEPSNADVVTRDASWWLRRRLGQEDVSVLAGPTPTTLMAWFGGFRGLGTLYWENLEGLRASAEVYGAADESTARALLSRHGITHIVFFSWDRGLQNVARSAAIADRGADLPYPDGFLARLELDLQSGRLPTLPPWLVPLPYTPVSVTGLRHPVVQMLEVVDPVAPEATLVHLARYYQAIGDDRMEPTLARSLAIAPSVAGLAMLAQLQSALGNRAALPAILTGLRAELDRAPSSPFADRFDAAVALGLGGDYQAMSRQLALALDVADERSLRRLTPERLSLLVDLSRQLGVDRQWPEAISLAVRLMSGS